MALIVKQLSKYLGREAVEAEGRINRSHGYDVLLAEASQAPHFVPKFALREIGCIDQSLVVGAGIFPKWMAPQHHQLHPTL
jgi:hypothetical protein